MPDVRHAGDYHTILLDFDSDGLTGLKMFSLFFGEVDVAAVVAVGDENLRRGFSSQRDLNSALAIFAQASGFEFFTQFAGQLYGGSRLANNRANL